MPGETIAGQEHNAALAVTPISRVAVLQILHVWLEIFKDCCLAHDKPVHFTSLSHSILKALLIFSRDFRADLGPPLTDRKNYSSVVQKQTLGNFQGEKTKGKAGWIFLSFYFQEAVSWGSNLY